MGTPMSYPEAPLVIDDNGNKVYAQILIRCTLEALEQYMRTLGLI